jgi:hypothetical protein
MATGRMAITAMATGLMAGATRTTQIKGAPLSRRSSVPCCLAVPHLRAPKRDRELASVKRAEEGCVMRKSLAATAAPHSAGDTKPDANGPVPAQGTRETGATNSAIADRDAAQAESKKEPRQLELPSGFFW